MAAIRIAADHQAAPASASASSPPPPATAAAADPNVADMALYGLERARARLAALDAKPVWDAADTASFDCMHYLGDAALHAAAAALRLQPGARVVDVGAGFGATGRFLHRHYGADVTGIELQPAIHALAETITARNRLSAHARSLRADVAALPPAAVRAPVDHVVSFLCILHVPDRAAVFAKMAALLRPAGGLYLEDYFAREPLDDRTARTLRDVVSCPYLPSRERYVADLQAAGFADVVFEEVTHAWADHVHARAIEYRRSSEPEPLLMAFYDTIDELFRGGKLGGARIVARKME